MTTINPMAMSMQQPQAMMMGRPTGGFPMAQASLPMTGAAGMPQVAMMPQPQMMPQGMQVPQGYGYPTAGPTAALPLSPAPSVVTPQMAMQGGTVPAAAAQGMLGAEGMKPPSTLKTVLKSALVTGGIGAALGAGVGALPFIPGGFLMGGIVGGIAGVLVGTVRGFTKANQEKEQFQAMMSTPQAPAVDPGSLGPEVPVAPAKAARRARRKAKAAMQAQVAVKPGDTLGAIAKAHKTTVKAIHERNKDLIGPDVNKLKVGLKLVVPGATEA